ncbi:MAG TPA: hypothetical protein VK932_25460 [Kofleriaceae bacterium]|nr:hypothetical protein [Kofleriaceae bacterium]
MHRIAFSLVLFLAACGGKSQAPPAPPPPQEPPATGECMKTGCSGTVCADEQVITTCEYRPEFACYKDATCERQADGNCGWTETAELTACLANPPPME